MKDIIDKLMVLADKSLETEDVPIGAVIVKDGIIIAEGYNTREKNQSVLGHAEINAILVASNYLDNWNLSGCSLYVTLKPCSMCMEVIKQSRIDNVYYLLDKPASKKEFNGTIFYKIDDTSIESEYQKLLNNFFGKLRKNK